MFNKSVVIAIGIVIGIVIISNLHSFFEDFFLGTQDSYAKTPLSTVVEKGAWKGHMAHNSLLPFY